MMRCPLCTRPTCKLGFNSARSIKQKLTGRHFATMWHPDTLFRF